jgi:hypothetical protein
LGPDLVFSKVWNQIYRILKKYFVFYGKFMLFIKWSLLRWDLRLKFMG